MRLDLTNIKQMSKDLEAKQYVLKSQYKPIEDEPFNIEFDFNQEIKDLEQTYKDKTFIKKVIKCKVEGQEKTFHCSPQMLDKLIIEFGKLNPEIIETGLFKLNLTYKGKNGYDFKPFEEVEDLTPETFNMDEDLN